MADKIELAKISEELQNVSKRLEDHIRAQTPKVEEKPTYEPTYTWHMPRLAHVGLRVGIVATIPLWLPFYIILNIPGNNDD